MFVAFLNVSSLAFLFVGVPGFVATLRTAYGARGFPGVRNSEPSYGAEIVWQVAEFPNELGVAEGAGGGSSVAELLLRRMTQTPIVRVGAVRTNTA